MIHTTYISRYPEEKNSNEIYCSFGDLTVPDGVVLKATNSSDFFTWMNNQNASLLSPTQSAHPNSLK